MTAPTQFHPNTIPSEEVKGRGLICFLNLERSCGPDCMSFIEAPEGEDYRGKQWANCLLLVNIHRGGKHLAVLASQGSELLKQQKVRAADQQRTGQSNPPVPK